MCYNFFINLQESPRMQNYLRKATESLGSLKNKVKQGFRVLAPGHTAWKGAALGVALLAALSWIALAYAAFASAGLLSFILAIIGGFVLAIIVGGLLTLYDNFPNLRNYCNYFADCTFRLAHRRWSCFTV